MQAYTDSKRETDPHSLPDLEIQFLDADYFAQYAEKDDWYGEMESGWYYRHGSPGYMADSDWYGPWESEEAALEGARESQGF